MGANQSKRKSTSSTASKTRSPSRQNTRSPPIPSSSSPTSQHKLSQQPLQRLSGSSQPPSTPVLIDDDEEEEQHDDQARRRISIDFYSDDASILIKSRIVEDSNVSDNLPDEEYFPATLSSISSSSTSSLASALFSTASSPSSLSTVSIRSAKKFAPSSSPALSRVLAEQPSTQGLVNKTSANDEVVWRIQVAQDNILGERKDPVKIQQAYLDLERMAQLSIVESYYPLGVCYYRGPASDARKAMHWLSLAIKEGEKRLKQAHSDLLYTHVARANYCLGEILAKPDKALSYLQTAAHMGHATAQHIMGHHYQYDDVDLDRASAWYELAAQQGYGKAQAALGALLLEYPDHWTTTTAATRDQVVQTAIGWLNLAANQGNVRAVLQLAYLYEEGKLVRRNKQKAFEFYKRYYVDESRPNYATAHYLMGIAYRDGDVDLPQDHALALKHLNLSAKAGSPLAQRVLGVIYTQGICGVSVDEERAHAYFQSAAKLGDLLSYGWLGKQYEYGRGCNRSITEAIRCYEKASHEPSIAIPSHLALGLLFDRLNKHSQALVYFQRVANAEIPTSVTALDSKLVTYQLTARLKIAIYQAQGLANLPRDPVAAFQTYIDLSENNDFADAHIAIGDTFKQGLSVHGRVIIPVDLKRACEYYEKAAKMGDVTAQFKLADTLSNTIRDRTRAFTWYAMAAQQGHALAQYCQALYYLRGLEPVKKDLTQAHVLLEKAAEQGLTDAMVSLAQLLLQQKPSGSDNYQAFTWLHKAASKNDPAALRELAAAYENGNIPVDNQQARYQAGFQLLQIATSKNDARSWYAMARYYENGWSVEANAGEALRCLEKAEQLGYSRASLAIADMYERNSMRDLAFSKYAKVAARHDITSAFGWHARISRAKLVVLHDIGTDKDRAEMYTLLREMAKSGTEEQKADVFELLGICFEHGIGVQSNVTSAVEWYQKAVKLDTSSVNWSQERARARLAKLYMKSDSTRAVNYLLELAPKLDEMKAHQNVSETVMQAREARYLLGHMYLHGQGVAQDHALAKKWLGEAADQAHGAAAYELGMLELEQDNEREAKHRFVQGDTIGHAGCKRELAMLLYREHCDDLQWDGSETKDLLEDAEQLGDIEATVQLGKLHEKGLAHVIRPHRETALMFYVRAANKGHVDAMVYAAESYDAIKRYREAAAWFKKVPENRVSQIMLSSYQLQGLGGITKDEKKGLSRLLDLMESWDNPVGESEIHAFGAACVIIGECYELGRGTAQDKEAARMWYERGINDAKYSEAMVRLASLVDDPVAALELHRRAAEEGKHKEAQYQVGLCHKEGLAGLDKNLVAARRYLQKAAEQGHPLAAFELGNVLTDMGEYKEAMRWFEKAGNQMVPEALRTLGLLYHCGFSSPTKKKGDVFIIVQDYKRAFAYFLKASELGDETATMMVGSYFQEGYHPDFGVDYDKALQWYETAYKISHSPVVELVIGKLRHTQANEASRPEQVESLRKEAYRWFVKAAQAEDGVQVTDAKTMVALYHLNGWGGVKLDSKLGFEQLLSLAKEGVTQVFEEVARCYEEGIGVEKNRSKALSYWMDLAMAGDKTGLERVREYHRLGLATAQELKSAEDSYTLATDQSSHRDQSIPSSSSSSSLYSA